MPTTFSQRRLFFAGIQRPGKMPGRYRCPRTGPTVRSPAGAGKRSGSLAFPGESFGQAPGTSYASSGPGQGGIVTPTAASGPSPTHRNWKWVPAGIDTQVPTLRHYHEVGLPEPATRAASMAILSHRGSLDDADLSYAM
jgi:hypothetical protein